MAQSSEAFSPSRGLATSGRTARIIDTTAVAATSPSPEVASVLLLGITTYSTVTSHRPGRLAWALATVAMVGTFVLLPIYFVGANGLESGGHFARRSANRRSPG